MAKTNFSKAEGEFSETLHKMKVQELLQQADKVEGKTTKTHNEHILMLKVLKLEIKKLTKIDPNFYEKLSLNKKQIKTLLAKIEDLNPKQIAYLTNVKIKIDAYMKDLPPITDEQLIEKSVTRHIHKRFNVSDRWLPLW